MLQFELMAKKKHPTKKHSFKHGDRASPVPSIGVPDVNDTPGAVTPAAMRATSLTTADGRDFSYVGHDMRRLLGFSSVLVAVEIALWLIVEFTAFGKQIYDSIKL